MKRIKKIGPRTALRLVKRNTVKDEEAQTKRDNRLVNALRSAARLRFGCECPWCMWRCHAMTALHQDDPGHNDAEAPFECKQRTTFAPCRTCGHGQRCHAMGDCSECRCRKFLSLPQEVLAPPKPEFETYDGPKDEAS